MRLVQYFAAESSTAFGISPRPLVQQTIRTIFHFFRFIAFVHSYITIVLNILLKITMLTSFMVTTSKRLDYVCPAANRTWQRLTIISCDLTHERDTYFLNISHIIYLNYYLPRINRLQSKPLRLIKTNRVNSIIRHRMWLYA